MQSLLRKSADDKWLNLTPMIDVTFLLIIFFILTGVFASTERAALLPPELADTPELNDIKQAGRLIINIVPHTRSQLEAEPALTGQAAAWIVAGKKITPGDRAALVEQIQLAIARNAEVKIQLRADKSILFTQIAPVINALSAAGVTELGYIASPSAWQQTHGGTTDE